MDKALKGDKKITDVFEGEIGVNQYKKENLF